MLETQAGAATTLRLILMNMPPSLQWIAQSLPSDVATDLAKAKTAILELLYGKSGNVSQFMSISKGVTEHPIAFVIRCKNELEATNADLTNKFVLSTVVEKLVKNVNATLAVELKRKLTNVTSMDQIVTALKDAIQLTTQTVSPPNLAQTLSLDTGDVSVDAVYGRNFYDAKRKNTYKNKDQYRNKGQKSYQKLGSREQKTQPGRIRCWHCNGPHKRQFCKKWKKGGNRKENDSN